MKKTITNTKIKPITAEDIQNLVNTGRITQEELNKLLHKDVLPPTPPNEPNTIKKATQQDEIIQRAKDLIQIQLQQQEQIKKVHGKNFIPTPNTSLIKKWTGYGQDYEFTPIENLKEPALFLIRENSEIETYEDVKSGLFKIKTTDNAGKEKVKTLILTPEKMVKWQYGTKKDDRLQCWIAYENETIPYPSNVKIDSGIVATFIEQIILNFRMLDTEASSKWAWLTKLLPWLAGIAILGYIAYTFGWLDSFFVVASNTTNTTNSTLPANITQIVGNGVQVI